MVQKCDLAKKLALVTSILFFSHLLLLIFNFDVNLFFPHRLNEQIRSVIVNKERKDARHHNDHSLPRENETEVRFVRWTFIRICICTWICIWPDGPLCVSITRFKVGSDVRFEAWKEEQLQRRQMVDKACAQRKSWRSKFNLIFTRQLWSDFAWYFFCHSQGRGVPSIVRACSLTILNTIYSSVSSQRFSY